MNIGQAIPCSTPINTFSEPPSAGSSTILGTSRHDFRLQGGRSAISHGTTARVSCIKLVNSAANRRRSSWGGQSWAGRQSESCQHPHFDRLDDSFVHMAMRSRLKRSGTAFRRSSHTALPSSNSARSRRKSLKRVGMSLSSNTSPGTGSAHHRSFCPGNGSRRCMVPSLSP
jgi:hypothetical protein